MPTYEYLCKSCSHRFEQWQRMTDEPLVTCPECGGYIRRVFYPAGIVFKGSGFYKTDSHASSVAASNGHTKKSEDGRHSQRNAPTDATSESKSTGESKSASTASGSSSTGTSSSENKVAAPTK